MKQNLVSRRNINFVLDGFQKFFQRCLSTGGLNSLEMKNFMEPIFARVGYRDPLHGGGPSCNILLIHDVGIGDFIVMSAAVREIRRIWSTANITLIINPRAREIAECCPYVDEVIVNAAAFDGNNFEQLYIWNADIAKILLDRQLDICFSFNYTPTTILLAYMSGARERLGFRLSLDMNTEIFVPPDFLHCYHLAPLLTVEVPHLLCGTHQADSCLAPLDYMLRTPIANRELEVWFTPSDRALAKKFIAPLIDDNRKIFALGIGGSAPIKRWPPKKYAALVRRLVAYEPDIKFVIIGGEADIQSAETFKSALDEKFIANHLLDLTGKLNCRQSAAAIGLCDLYIGNDTGALHMASANKVPILNPNCFPMDIPMTQYAFPIIYAPYHVPSVVVRPAHALPECRHSRGLGGCCVPTTHCIAQIEADTVFDGYLELKKRIAEKNIEPLFISNA